MSRATILLTGATGQLGYELQSALAPHGEIVACRRGELDVSDAAAIAATVRALRPQIIVNAAAYTAVDRAESDAAAAQAINATAPEVFAGEARRLGATLIHFSTDYVFDGSATAPYTEQATPRPISVYGRSKLDGELAIESSGCVHLIFRTSWVYGQRGGNFLLTMQRLARERDELRIVDDQIGVPNWSRDLAAAIAKLVAGGTASLTERSGLYHLSARGPTSWFGFARAIVGDVARPRVVPISTAAYPTPARRPAYGVLATEKFENAFGFALGDWRDALRRCLSSQRSAA
ncbi:MAG: dTDP-4-dehydrorhamnose reductase [Betaproteobacteria bacterium]